MAWYFVFCCFQICLHIPLISISDFVDDFSVVSTFPPLGCFFHFFRFLFGDGKVGLNFDVSHGEEIKKNNTNTLVQKRSATDEFTKTCVNRQVRDTSFWIFLENENLVSGAIHVFAQHFEVGRIMLLRKFKILTKIYNKCCCT